MKNFGDTIRELRVAQDLGLRETAGKIGISPAYLSRIERGKENPPKPEVIKTLAKELAADPDVLFRLSSSTDPEVAGFLNDQPGVMELLRFIKEANFNQEQFEQLLVSAKAISTDSK
ncbi:helix-turn-helix domain-containing protein [bacterium]|nr:helix-turn-helix domain-containing protein [bacterium]